MSEKKTTAKKGNSETPKSILLNTTIREMSANLSGLKETLGERKFEKRIRKAAKILIEGLKPLNPGKPEPKANLLPEVPKMPKVKKTAPKKMPAKKKVARVKKTAPPIDNGAN